MDVALFETGLSLVGYQLTDALRTGIAPGPEAALSFEIVPAQPLAFPTNFPSEFFYLVADATGGRSIERVATGQYL